MAPAEEPVRQNNLFDQLKFGIVQSATLNSKESIKIKERLEIHGAEAILDTYPAENFDLTGITHIISTTSDFPDYNIASDRFIPVVKPQWIDDSIAKERHAQPRQYSPNPRYFMSDVVVCCADIPEGDADAIAGGILAMGGNYTTKVTTLVTHIVALSTENDMCELAKQRNLDCKFVLPHWFDDCLKLGRKIDERPYELPDPEILQTFNTKAPNGRLRNEHVRDAMDPHPGDKQPVPRNNSKVTILKEKVFMLSKDLGVGEYLRGILEGMIMAGDGHVAENVEEADYLVCKYRDGNDYKQASKAGIDVGNLAWLYYLITHNQWTSPFRRLLHYPVARHGLPGFQKLKISLSNYSGEARTYMENLIAATGAECTKTLRQENTHLITAHDQSEKCAAAKDWNIHMINHLWLEDSYAQWQMQSVTKKRYTHFPPRTNLGEVVGQTQIDRKVIERYFLHDDDTEMVDAPTTDQAVSKNKLSSFDTDQSSPTPSKGSRKKNLSNGAVKDEQEKYQTPVTSKHFSTGKENMTPLTTGSRKSKDVALAKLHNLTPDIALYEKERKRVGGVVHGGRRKIEEPSNKASLKRSIDDADTDNDETDNKKQRAGPAPVAIHLLISGYKRWIGKAKEEDTEIKQLRELGIVVVHEPAKATHLAVPHIVRTPKFVVALAYAPIIINTKFIDACLEDDEFHDPDDFKLKDTTNEKKMGTSLKLSCERAKENRHRLLAGRHIYVVEKISGGFETYKGIVEANGGQCMTYRGRPATIPSKRAGSESSVDEDPSNEVILICNDEKDDPKLWSRFVKMAEGSRKVPRIVKSDWLLDTAMCQKIQPTAPYEMHVGS